MRTIKECQIELEKLESELTGISKPTMRRAEEIRQELNAAYFAAFEKNAYLKEKLIKLELSLQLTCVEYDSEFFHQWIRVDFSKIFSTADASERAALDEFLEHVQADTKNDCLTSSIGPCIIINDDGAVYDQDSGKNILPKSHDRENSERNAEIEAYMEKSGYFPSVVRVDYYGSPIKYVNTQAKTGAV